VEKLRVGIPAHSSITILTQFVPLFTVQFSSQPYIDAKSVARFISSA
jgi:hypothetical protein